MSALPSWLAGSHPRRTLVRVALLVVGALVVFTWILMPVRGVGISMAPTIADGRLVFINRLAYRFGSPRRFDIVAVRMAGPSIVYVKRIIGLPGERLRIEDGVVYVGEEAVDEPYVRYRAPWALEAITLDAGQYFVVGDNRGMPMRLHELGLVSRDRLIGSRLF